MQEIQSRYRELLPLEQLIDSKTVGRVGTSNITNKKRKFVLSEQVIAEEKRLSIIKEAIKTVS